MVAVTARPAGRSMCTKTARAPKTTSETSQPVATTTKRVALNQAGGFKTLLLERCDTPGAFSPETPEVARYPGTPEGSLYYHGLATPARGSRCPVGPARSACDNAGQDPRRDAGHRSRCRRHRC